jgi:hypothetical protein
MLPPWLRWPVLSVGMVVGVHHPLEPRVSNCDADCEETCCSRVAQKRVHHTMPVAYCQPGIGSFDPESLGIGQCEHYS